MERRARKEPRGWIVLMAKYRRSKTNTTFFMDIPKNDCYKKFKQQDCEQNKNKGELTWPILE